ncbi:hypothetical protein TNCV_2413881 [Trichonephila clavipes]|nr:hypothetical protein TNCV_2413881 [Trichonephila clavipes]
MRYEVQLQGTLPYNPLAVGEYSLPNSKLALAENGRGVNEFRLTFYKRSNDSHVRDEQQPLYLTRVYQQLRLRGFLPDFTCVQLFVDRPHIWRRGTNIFHEVDDVTAETFCDTAFFYQESTRDTFVIQLCHYHLNGRTCNACRHFQNT